MSYEYYSKWWAAGKAHLGELMARDLHIQEKTKDLKNRNLANDLIGGLYARYSMLVQDIGTCLDQMAQPQKRITVRKLVDSAVTRLQELNEELRKIDISEFHYIDGTLIELKLIPHQVEIMQPPLYYPRTMDLKDLVDKARRGETLYMPPLTSSALIEIVDETGQNKDASNQANKEIKTLPSKISQDVKSAESKMEQDPKSSPSKTEAKGGKRKKRPNKFMSEEPVLSKAEQEILKTKQKISSCINLVQTAERGRQERLYFNDVYASYKIRKAMAAGQKVTAPTVDLEKQANAALIIQKVWRGYSGRKWLEKRENERRLLIGMVEPSWKSMEQFQIMERNFEKRRALRDQRIREYIEANLNERVRLFKVIGPGLMEDISDEIREWFYQFYIRAKNFDEYPPEEKGGSILVVRGETLTPEEWLDEAEKKRKEKAKMKGKDKAKEKEKKRKEKERLKALKKKEKEKAKAEKLKAKKKKAKFTEFEFKFEETPANNIYNEAMVEYKKLWNERKDEDNPLEKYYMDLISEENCYEMQLELRKNVDELMRIELELLQNALEEDRMKLKKGKKGKKKKKDKKSKKQKKKKGPKDPNEHRSTEDLFQELLDNGIIHTYPTTFLKQYHGDFSYSNWNKRCLDYDPPATLGDVRQAVELNCIIPLSVEVLKKPKSVLIAGPRQSGKHLLANAIFTETQCVLFDLSPEITAGKYPGKQGLKMLFHLVTKMSRILQPSIIYFDGAEKLFYKKVPKEEKQFDPKRLGKRVFKDIVKPIKPEDKILVLGISGKPWTGKPSKLKKCFERVLLIPRPDYGSIHLYWRELLMPYHAIDRNFDVSCLTKVTMYYPFSSLRNAVKAVLSPRRIIQLKFKPLSPLELYEPLLSEEPITDKEYQKFEKWYSKYPIRKERLMFNQFAEKLREAEARQKEKAKK